MHIMTTIRTKPKPPSPKRLGASKQRAPRGDGGVKQLPSGVWQARIKRYGEDIKRQAPTQNEALRLLEQLRRTRPSSNTELSRLPLADWLERYRNEQASSVRLKTRAGHVECCNRAAAIIGRIPLGKITPSDLRHLLSTLIDKGLSPSVQRHTWQFTAAALRRAFEDDIIPSNPAAKVKAPKGGNVRERISWTRDEAKKALECAKNTSYYTLLYFLIVTRVRPNEALGLMWGDISTEQVFVRRTVVKAGKNPIYNPPKTAKGLRLFYIPTDLQRLLEQHRTAQKTKPKADSLVFATKNGTPLLLSNVRRYLTTLCAKAGIARVSPHELRHTGITLGILAGANRKQLSSQAGHEKLSTTDIYDHSDLDELERRKVALPLAVLLGESFPYDSVTSPESSLKSLKVGDTGNHAETPKTPDSHGMNRTNRGVK
jgi:integrase